MSIKVVQQALELQRATVDRWHHEPIEVAAAVAELLAGVEVDYVGLAASLFNDRDWLETICRQHSFNFELWHQEDIARSPVVSDDEMARVKRAIDGFNQKRNDWIERVDDYLSDHLERLGVKPSAEARLNTETPGSVLDRLSIMSLRLYHLQEQLERDDVDQEHRDRVIQKIQICQIQQKDLAQSLGELLDDIQSGCKRHRTYRQCKMYNDPSLNPAVYNARKAA